MSRSRTTSPRVHLVHWNEEELEGLSEGAKVRRRIALDAGLVDFKVCAVNQTWSGFRFSRRR